MSDNNSQNRGLAVVGAIAAIMAAIITIVGAILLAYLYIDDKYVHNDDESMKKFWSAQEAEASRLVVASAKKIDAVIEEKVQELNGVVESSKAELEESNSLKAQIKGLLTETKGELDEIRKNGISLVNIARIVSNGEDALDSGYIPTRVLRFNKKNAETVLRITYNDNIRVHHPANAEAACRWSIKVNDEDCPSIPIYTDMYMANAASGNHHRSSQVLSTCNGVPAGEVTLQVEVKPFPEVNGAYPGSDCHTGWNNSTWMLEAMELWLNE